MNRCHPPHRSAARWPSSALRAWLAPLALFLSILAVSAGTAETPAPAPTPATDPVALDKKLIEEAKTHSELMKNLTELSDNIGSRLTGSAALKRANDWAAEKMKSYGLTDVHLEGWTIPVGWERGTATMRIVEPMVSQPLTVAAMGWTPSTPGKVVGEVVVLNAKNSKELAAYKGKLKNAIVLQGKPQEMRPVTETNLFGGGGGRRRGPRGGGDDAANPDKGGKADAKPGEKAVAKPADKAAPKADPKTDPKLEEKVNARTNPAAPAKGDAKSAEKAPVAKGGPGGGADGNQGMMRMYQQMMAFRREMREFLHAEGVACMLMDSDKPHGLLNMTGSWPGNDRVSGADPLPSLFIVHEHYAQLYRLATRPGGGHTKVEVEIHNTLTPGPIAVYNTIGEIKGSEKPDEFVVLGAHIDSWDLGQGTTDNGTGTCVVLEAARILAKSGVKPKRTIRFCLFSGEEQGLFGSREYVKKHAAEMPKTSMALVHDTGTGKVQGIGTEGRESVKPILEPELVSLKELGLTDINTRSMPGSDHMSFESAGVPGFAVQQDWAEYRFTHHSQSDTLDKAKEADLIQGAQVLAVAGMRVANLPQLLPHDRPPRRSPWDSPPAGEKAGEKAAPKEAAKAAPGKEAAKSTTEPATAAAAPAKAAPVPQPVTLPRRPGNQ